MRFICSLRFILLFALLSIPTWIRIWLSAEILDAKDPSTKFCPLNSVTFEIRSISFLRAENSNCIVCRSVEPTVPVEACEASSLSLIRIPDCSFRAPSAMLIREIPSFPFRTA